MAFESDDLVLAGGALLALLGVGLLLRRPKTPMLPTPAPTAASGAIATRTVAPKAATSTGVGSQPTAAKSQFSPGTELVTQGPYPEIGYRFDALSRPNTATLKNGARAGKADGVAFRYGAHLFERLTREGRKVFIVQSLLAPATAPQGSTAKASFAPQAHYVVASASTPVHSNLTHQVVGELPAGTLVGILKRTLQVAGQSFYLVDAKDSYFDLRIPAAKARAVTGAEAKEMVARGAIARYGVVSRLGQRVSATALPPYFSFLSGPAGTSPTKAYFQR